MNDTETAFRRGRVFVQGNYAGMLEEVEDGYTFTYHSAYLKANGPAVSLTIPLREEPFFSETLFPFFDGLIPEGWLLSVVTRNWKLDPEDRFGLLLVSCEDSIGDVSVKNAGRESFDEDRESRIVTAIAGNQKNKEVPRK